MTRFINLQGRDFPREKIRIRDNHTCQLCGLKWEPGMRRLDIHHLDAKKDKTRGYDKPEEYDNCITLCHSCHLSLPVHRNACKKAAQKNGKKVNEFIKEKNWLEEKRKIKFPTPAQKRKWNVYG